MVVAMKSAVNLNALETGCKEDGRTIFAIVESADPSADPIELAATAGMEREACNWVLEVLWIEVAAVVGI